LHALEEEEARGNARSSYVFNAAADCGDGSEFLREEARGAARAFTPSERDRADWTPRMKWLLLLFVTSYSFAQPSLTVDFCRVMNDWRKDRFSFQELCSTHPANFCLGLAAEGQAICLAGKGRFCSNVQNTGQGICTIGGGTYCSSVQNTAQGICTVLQGDQCLQRPDTENFLWLRKLHDACKP